MTVERKVSDLLAEVALRVEDGNHGEYRPRPAEFVPEGVAYVRAADMTSGIVDFIAASRINDVAVKRIRKGIGQPGDVLLSHKGTVGKVATVPPDAPEFVCSPQTTLWRSLDPRVIDQRYLSFALSSKHFQRQLDLLKSQSDMAPYVSLTDQRSMTLLLPPVEEQRAIAEVLGALDDKIAANRELLSGTDGLVRARYDQVMASAGRTRELRDVATNPRQTVAPEEVDPGELHVGLEHIPRRQMWLGAVGTAAEVTSSKSAFQESDVLFGKLRPYFHKVVAAPGAGICSTDVLVVRAVEPEMSGLVLAACSSDAAIAAATSAADGTRMPRAKWKDIAQLRVPAPDSPEVRYFSAEVDAFARQASALRVENEQLAITRDGLLPLLMSGKLRVKDAEKQIGEVV